MGVEMPPDLGADAVHGAVEIRDEGTERQVGQQFADRDRQGRADPVDPDRHGSRRPADAGGAKFDIGIDAHRTKQIARHRIEEGAVEIAVRAPQDDFAVNAPDLCPQRRVRALRVERFRQGRDAAHDVPPVQFDALYRIVLRPLPIA